MPNGFKKNDRKETERTLFNLYHKRVYNTAYYIIKDRYLAQDVLQETFVKAFQKMNTLEDEKKIGAWLDTVATNIAIDRIRKEKRWNGIPTEDVLIESESVMNEMAPSLEQQVVNQETEQLIQSKLQKLNKQNRQIVVMKYMNELKDEEIAELLQIKLGTVKSHLHRAKKKLKTMLLKSGKITDGDS